METRETSTTESKREATGRPGGVSRKGRILVRNMEAARNKDDLMGIWGVLSAQGMSSKE